MNVTEYFLKNGKINASKSKALKLIEKVWPNLNSNSHIRSSMFINNVFDKIEKKFQPSNALRGSIFEYLIMCVFFRNDINPFFYQVNLNFVHNVTFDLVLFDTNKKPIIISLKTSGKDAYKQVELEFYAAKQVHKNCRTIYVTYEDDAVRFIERKKELSEIHSIDEIYSTQDKDFDKLIKDLSSRDYIDPQKINYVRTGIFLGD
ncbi:hypothetical protein [Candidatus Pelagibacter sp. HIMB1611]|uniref:hypothetical protein n=1 Tax=Candidatus Pelagibacter sp. HIMB1611 TaxID=3413357 RepID=UPI003F87707A